MADTNDTRQSSGEYSGVVEEANVGMSSKGSDLAAVLSSGANAKKYRDEQKAKREQAKKDDREREERQEKESNKEQNGSD